MVRNRLQNIEKIDYRFLTGIGGAETNFRIASSKFIPLRFNGPFLDDLPEAFEPSLTVFRVRVDLVFLPFFMP
jgi:hypothetical protein